MPVSLIPKNQHVIIQLKFRMVNTFTYSHVHYLLSYKNFLDSSICIANNVNITLNRSVYLVAF